MRYAAAGMILLLLCGCPPPDTRAPLLRDAVYTRAQVMFLEGRFNAAADSLAGYVRSNPEPQAYLLRGKCLLLDGRFASAATEFRRAAEVAEVLQQQIDARLGLADALYSEREYEECADIYADLLADFRTRIPADITLLRYGHTLIRLGDREEGREILAEIAREFPRSVAAREAAALRDTAREEFYVQVGRFGREDNAQALQQELLLQNLEARIRMEGTSFTVIVGYYEDMNDARRSLEAIKAAGFAGAFIKP